ncbi:conserved phage C-terminal domain-containing protein [Sporosarcina sp. BP05]|uniref:conserved phage C-terminal domain-containing protein n=1 Tax=Sporosarcina sp. BP05 TaxID=2758726 RepID=UPI0016453BE3
MFEYDLAQVPENYVIDSLNDKACKHFNSSSKATARLVKGCFSEGYTLADCKKVIDTKAKN